MPDSFPNPYGYTSPLGQAFGNLAKTLMSGPREDERIKGADEALKLRNARVEGGTIADLWTKYGTPEYDPRLVAAAAARGGADLSKLGDADRYLAYNVPGTSVETRDRSYGGAGGAYSGTETGFGIDQSNQ